MRASIIYCCYFLLCLPITSNASDQAEDGSQFLERLFQGVVMFESLQGHHLNALLKLNTGLTQYGTERLPQIKNSPTLSNGLSITELQLAFGLSQFSENQVAESDTAFQLARYYYNKQQPVKTIQTLESIESHSENISTDDIQYLQALAYLGAGKFKAAAEILEHIPSDKKTKPYIQYNLAMAQLQTGKDKLARSTLTALGSIVTNEDDKLALKDLANLKLAYLYLKAAEYEQAKNNFNRIRLDGPFTDQALLGSGWASFFMGQSKRAIVPWSRLHENEAINDSIIEAKLALPYAYSKLGAHGKAANLYAHAVNLFEAELSGLDASMNAIRNGELRQAIAEQFDSQGDDWFIDMSRRPDQQQFHFPLLLANKEFRRSADNLQQLAQVKNRIEQGQISITAYTELGKLKQKHYSSSMPDTEKELFDIYEKMKRFMPDDIQPSTPEGKINKAVSEVILLRSSYRNYLKIRKATTEHYQQLPVLNSELSDLTIQLQHLNEKLNSAISRTGQQMESEALSTLDQKREQLQNYHSNALFALAESYDLATGKAQ